MRWRVITFSAVIFVAITLAVVYLSLPRLLSAQLPGLLTRVMDKPVVVGEITVSLLSLRAEATRLVIGDPDAPALLAENVEVVLNGQALLRGEIRLHDIGASFASFDFSGWQGEGEGKPLDRNVTNRWLPEHAHIDTLAVYSAERLLSMTEDNIWQRLTSERQLLTWTQAGFLSPVAVRLEFSPVFELLQDQRGDIQLEVVRQDEPEGILSAEITIAPAESGGVQQRIQLETGAIAGSWSFTSEELLAWPQTSVLRIQTLDVGRIQEVLAEMIADPAAEPQDWLQSPLPRLALPSHLVDVNIDELLIDDEAISGIVAQLVVKAGDEEIDSKIEVNDLFARLSDADLSGDLTFAVGAQWELAIDLIAESQDREAGLEAFFADSDWRWQRGRADFTTQGTTPIELFENARGIMDADGVYLAAEALPLHLRADFKSERGLLGSDALELQIGESKIAGAVWTDDSRRALSARLTSSYLNIDDLRSGDAVEDDGPVAVVIPDLRWFPSDLPIDVEFAGDVLQVAGLRFTDVELGLQHSAERVSLDLSLNTSLQGRVSLAVEAQRFDVERALQLDLNVIEVGLAQLGVDVPVSIASAHLALSGRGISLPGIVPNLVGELALQLSSASLSEDIQLNTNPVIGAEAGKVSTVSLTNLNVQMANVALATGRVQISVTEPAVTGQLSSAALNLDTLIEPSNGTGRPSEIAPLLQALVPVDLQLRMGELTLQQQVLTGVDLLLQAQPGRVDVGDASFASDYGRVQWQGSLVANNGGADLKLDGSVQGLEVASLPESQLTDLLDKPLAGTIALRARGADWAQIYNDARLRLQLKEAQGSASSPSEFDVDAELRQLADGRLQADIAELHWRENDLHGIVTFQDVQPPKLQADLISSYLDLTLMTQAQAATGVTESRGGLIRSVTSAASQTLGFLTSGVRSTLGTKEQASDLNGGKFFNPNPWSVESLDLLDANIKIAAERVKMRRGEARDVTFTGNVGGRRLVVEAKSPDVNGGPLDFVLIYDATRQPAQAEISATLENVRPNPLPGVAPISAFVDLTGQGDNEGDLVGSLTGPVYIAAGGGTTSFSDFGGGLLTGDLMQSLFGVLLPSTEKAPQLSCAIGYGELVDGKFVVPAAIVMQTGTANILVQAQADFAQETISAQFDSRSRTGTGLSVGNIFSNTVRLEGSLSAPKIVTNKTSLLWRYGAAVATGGLSLLGESLYKRLMIDTTPCATMKATLQANVCEPGSPLKDSTLVCG